MLADLSRYTHRVAISNHLPVSTDANTLVFRWKDYRIKRGNRMKIMRLDTDEFIRRFLNHVPSSGFHRIRHAGFLANGIRRDRIVKIRPLVDQHCQPSPIADIDAVPEAMEINPRQTCPKCGGRLFLPL